MSTLYEQCESLFKDYPLAVDPHGRMVGHTMVLRGEGEAFYAIVRARIRAEDDPKPERPSYYLWKQNAGQQKAVVVDTDTTSISDELQGIIEHGMPIPRHGSVFGWKADGKVTAVLVVYSKLNPKSEEIPRLSPMLLAGSPERPPFLGENQLGRWFWNHVHDGSFISLDKAIGETQNLVFWTSFGPADDPTSVFVVDPVLEPHPDGFVLSGGVYVCYKDLDEGKQIPEVAELLARDDKIDLGPRFKRR